MSNRADRIAPLAAALAQAKHFEDAADRVLRAMLSCAFEAIDRSRWKKAKLRRALVHHRPEDAIRRLLIVEHDDKAAPRANALAPPGSAWRWVSQYGEPVAINVHGGSVMILGENEKTIDAQSSGLNFQESQRRMLDREVTHVLALPLRGPGGTIEGMIAIEAGCAGALAVTELVWKDCLTELKELAEVASLHLAHLSARPRAATPDQFLPVIGREMQETIGQLRSFARGDDTLFLRGATGTGKSKLARWVHEVSPRQGQCFEALNLHNIAESLQAGELFGWKKGAFTDATSDHAGAVARAEGGTLFLDEIDKLSLATQSTLLQLLDEKVYRPLRDSGGERRADVRFIVGSNADLRAAVKNGTFREDLYYRINVLPVRLPPLDRRADEIADWARFMAERAHVAQKGPANVAFDPRALALLEGRRWPGNLRQLDNVVRRSYAYAAARADEPRTILPEHVRFALGAEDTGEGSPLVDAFVQLAHAFVAEAKKRFDAGLPPMSLDHDAAVRGFVLAVAVAELGKNEAFKLLGKEQLVQDRNHTKTLKREVERAQKLCAELGVRFPLGEPDGDD